MGRAKYLLVIVVLELILVGLSYVMAAQSGFMDNSLANVTFIEFLPDECEVYDKSPGITAGIEFKRNKYGDIADRTSMSLITRNVYAGSHAAFRITAKNMSNMPLIVDEYQLMIGNNNSYLSGALCFSGKIKIYRNDYEYYDLLGEFKNVRLSKLAENLTSIMKYRKIDIGEKLVIELNQQIDTNRQVHEGKSGLQYSLMPVFRQYYPPGDEGIGQIGETVIEG